MKVKVLLATVAFAFIVSGLLANPAIAGCRSSAGLHSVGMTQVSQTLEIDRGTGCTVSRTPCTECALQSASLASKPAHGSISQQGKYRFRYAPSKSYTGQDSFSVRWCEKKPSDPHACYTVTYSAVVE